TARYPVLYLVHGGGDVFSSWTTAGAANIILDNLIAQKKAFPMIMSCCSTEAISRSCRLLLVLVGEQRPPHSKSTWSKNSFRMSMGATGLLLIGSIARWPGFRRAEEQRLISE